MKWLLRLLDPDVPRREYPEGSFSVVIALAEGLLGLTPIWNTGTLQTVSSLNQSLSFAEMKHISVFGGEIDLRQEESASVLTNRTGREIQWKAGFDGKGIEGTRENPAEAFFARWMAANGQSYIHSGEN